MDDELSDRGRNAPAGSSACFRDKYFIEMKQL